MKTKAQEQFDRQIRQIQRSLDQQDLCLQDCMNENENIRCRVASLINRTVPEDVIANGTPTHALHRKKNVDTNGDNVPDV